MRTGARHRQGFTVVEVIVSIGVMMIGAMALFGLQQQITRANAQAREMTIATQIAQTWIERLKLDAGRWIVATGVPANDLANTDMLKNVTASGAEGAFTTIALGLSGLSPGYDFYGDEVANLTSANMSRVRYCVSYRLTWVYPATSDRALRADVRVWWPKDVQLSSTKNKGNDIETDFPLCADDGVKLNPGTDGIERDNYHIVYLSTVLRPVPT